MIQRDFSEESTAKETLLIGIGGRAPFVIGGLDQPRPGLLGKGITTEHTENTEFTIGLPSGIVDGQGGLDKRLPVWPNM